MPKLTLLSVVLLFAASTVHAQQPAGPGETVSGRVTFADTNGPARFAQVLLKNTAPTDADNPFAEMMKDDADKSKDAKPKLSAEDEAAQKKQLAASMKMMASLADLMQAATAAADGTFILSGVQPGTYYIHATAKGYIDPIAQFSDDELASTDPAVRKRIAAVATIVTVTASSGAHAEVRLARGASISGRVLYDDGTPAAGWAVRTVHDAPAGEANPFASMGLDASDVDITHAREAAVTDDTGYYRISGLPAGDYVVQARLTGPAIGHVQSGPREPGLMAMMGLRLTVYSGDSVRRSLAKPVTVHEGESRAGYDLTLPLSTMHAVAGVVRAKTDGHPVNAGTVGLTALGADGKEDAALHFITQVQADGSFHFDYVPGATTYSLEVTGAADQTQTGPAKGFGGVTDKKVSRSYGKATLPVQLLDGDVTDLKLEVPEAPAAK